MRERFCCFLKQLQFCIDYYWQVYWLALQEHKVLFVILLLLPISILNDMGIGWWAAAYLLLAYLLMMIAVIDSKFYIIPDILLLCGIWICIAADAVTLQMNLTELAGSFMVRMANGLAVFIPLLLFVLLMDRLLQKETMGGGDIKLFFLVSFCMGAVSAMLVLLLSCIVGIVWQIGILWRKPGSMLPFGPSIAIAAWIVLLHGTQIMEKFFCIPL